VTGRPTQEPASDGNIGLYRAADFRLTTGAAPIATQYRRRCGISAMRRSPYRTRYLLRIRPAQPRSTPGGEPCAGSPARLSDADLGRLPAVLRARDPTPRVRTRLCRARRRRSGRAQDPANRSYYNAALGRLFHRR
jgi:hypothetical protein